MITMITAEQANEIREKHTLTIKNIIEEIDLAITKKALEVECNKEIWFNMTSHNSIITKMIIEIVKAHNFDVVEDKGEDGKFLHITWK